MTLDFVAWHDRSAVDHQAQLARFSSLGYRFVSLSVYNTAQNPLYAGVMVKRPVAGAQREFHDLSESTWIQTFNEQASQGFGPVILTATGATESPLFAAVFEERTPIPLTHHRLTSGSAGDTGTIQGMNATARQSGAILHWAGMYGDVGNPRYLGIWLPNPDNVIWNADGVGDTAGDYQRRFDAQTSGWARPAFVTLGAQRYLSLFVDNQIGPWVARHDLTSSEYQAEFDHWVSQGFFPLVVQASGVGDGARFAVLFATQGTPLARQWTVTGGPEVTGIDQAMQKTMQASKVRAAVLALVQDRKLVLARGYTWAEAGYPVTQPTTLFRVASCSMLNVNYLCRRRGLELPLWAGVAARVASEAEQGTETRPRRAPRWQG